MVCILALCLICESLLMINVLFVLSMLWHHAFLVLLL